MTIFYGTMDRKALVAAIEEITGEKRKYLGVPSCAYQVGSFQVTREGNLDDGGCGRGAELAEALAGKGFVADMEAACGAEATAGDGYANEKASEPQPPSEGQEAEEEVVEMHEVKDEVGEAQSETAREMVDSLVISIPADKVNKEKLASLLEAKGELIRKALGVEELSMEEAEGMVMFSWFKGGMDADRAQAYINFVSAICRMSMEQKRIQSRDRGTVNEKYTFRCFLLRLGFIGKEFKRDRKILLERLSGSTAFRMGRKESGNEDTEQAGSGEA